MLLTSLTVSQATTATAADSLTYLGDVTGSSDVAVGGGKVFVAMDDRIIVADTEGTLTGVITGVSETRDLVTSSDGTRLYAALRGSNEVAEINTTDLTITRRIDLTAYPCPDRLALSGHWLWVSHGCPATSSGGALSLDMSLSTPQPAPVSINPVNAPQIVAAGNTLVLTKGKDLQVYDMQGGTVMLRGTIDAYDHGLWNGWGDIALAPDGSTAYTTPGSANDFEAWDLTTLTRTRSYGKEEGVLGYGSITVSPDGAQIAVSRDTNNVNDEPLVLFDANTGAKAQMFGASLIWTTHGLAFSDSDLFAVVEKTIDRSLHLLRLHGARLPSCKLVVTGPEKSQPGKTITFTGQLTEHDSSAPGVQQLTVALRRWDGTTTMLPDVTTNADGTYTFSHTPYFADRWSYDVYRENTPDSRSCKASVIVNVSRF
ncbi:hypothetical protein ABZ260_23960 [Streptosporangium sp. NPDC006013]|uniref:YncE family protein n=1 Tax=Streptosporangium sp. NPDC006013 TaxID=3155596 RepID=UPI00339F27B3